MNEFIKRTGIRNGELPQYITNDISNLVYSHLTDMNDFKVMILAAGNRFQ